MKNFNLVNYDTDSLSVCKKDGSAFSMEEQTILLKELNDMFPEHIKFEEDGYFSKVVIVKAKNYVLYDGKKVKIKGSSLKASTKCPALKEFIKEIIQCIIDEKYNYLEIYDRYVKEIMNIKDISRFAVRKTVTDKVLNGERTNELKVLNAIQESEDDIQDGDKVYVYYKPDDTLSLVEKFNGDYNRERLLKNLYDTALCFETIIDSAIFTNYKLKKNKLLLEKFNG